LTPSGIDVKLSRKYSECIHAISQFRRRRVALAVENESAYEVLSPWAEADPIPLKGLSPRLTGLEGKKIGLLCNSKRAAPLILDAVERIIKERYPSSQTSRFEGRTFSVSSLEADRKQEFDDWIKGLDAVVAAVGD
jgi:hypothetical protein